MPSDSSPQRELFTNRPIWEEDDVRDGVIATVVLPEGVQKPLDYLVLNELVEDVEPGRRVYVPLGKGNRIGLLCCCATRRVAPTSLKSVVAVEDESHFQTDARTPGWMADRWMARRGDVLEQCSLLECVCGVKQSECRFE